MRRQKQTGFTIVELLIVIVVIGILAAITIVAYSGVQKKAYDSQRITAADSIQKALAMYAIDNAGKYPNGCTPIGTGCNVSTLAGALVPDYLTSIPNDPNTATPMQYVSRTTSDGYGLRVSYQVKPMCKYYGGEASASANGGWWGASVPEC